MLDGTIEEDIPPPRLTGRVEKIINEKLSTCGTHKQSSHTTRKGFSGARPVHNELHSKAVFHSCSFNTFSTFKNFQFSGSNGFRTRSQGFGSMPNRERNQRSGPGLYPEPEPELGVRAGPVRVRTDVPNRTFPSLQRAMGQRFLPAVLKEARRRHRAVHSSHTHTRKFHQIHHAPVR